jgi:hypothetical protein
VPPLPATYVRLVGAFHVVVVLEKGLGPGGRRSIDKEFRREFSTVTASWGRAENRCSDDPLVVKLRNE